jgi:putative oxidoreductase
MQNSLDQLLASKRDLAPTALRIALGTVFVAHAYAKAFVFTFAGTAAFFAAHGFPGWTAYPVFAAELLFGLALIAGYRTRVAALSLIPIMFGALVPHISLGWMFTNAGGGWEYVAFLLVALGAQALLGSGAYALDASAQAASRTLTPAALERCVRAA